MGGLYTLVCEEIVVGTCHTCREPIPGATSSSDDGNNNNKNKGPRIGINTALKAVLDTLYGAEMNQRRLANEHQKVKARGGEMRGLHTRGCKEIVALTEEDELKINTGRYNNNDNHEN